MQAEALNKIQKAPQDGSTHWSCRKMARELGVSKSTVQRIWAAARLQPHRSRLDPVSVKIVNALLPLPNSGTQYVSTANQNLDDTQYLIKIDHAICTSNHFSGRYL